MSENNENGRVLTDEEEIKKMLDDLDECNYKFKDPKTTDD